MENFFYCKTIQQFKSDVQNNQFMPKMRRSARQMMGNFSREENSWNTNSAALIRLVREAKLPDDTVIGFEYLIPVGGRIDCVLFGHGSDGTKNMVHVELKQWSNEHVCKHYDHQTFREEVNMDGKVLAHPSAQALEYHRHLLHYMPVFEKEDIHLHGMAYCYNYDTKCDNVDLLDSFYQQTMKECPLYGKNQESELAEQLSTYLGGGNGVPIKEAIVQSEVRPTQRLRDVAAKMFDGERAQEVFHLLDEQLPIFNAILGAVQNTPKDEKTVVIVKGGPGTGKTVVAMRLLAELYKPEYKCQRVHYATRPASLRNDLTREVTSIVQQDKNEPATKLIYSTFDCRPYNFNWEENGCDVLLVDEAQRLSESANHRTDSNRRNEMNTEPIGSNLLQFLAMLYTSRVCVCFIDDKQCIKTTEIGSSKEIRKMAESYFESVKAENKKYYDVDRPEYERQLIKAREQRNTTKINTLENKLKYHIVEPTIQKVNILEFELSSQFRCNGSNNYLDWIDDVLYKSIHKTRTLNRDSYDFQVFDNPNELYAKIRSLDEYARYVDKLKEETPSITNKEIRDKTETMTFHQRARLVAGWCWKWSKEQEQLLDGDLKPEVTIPECNFAMPWETQTTFNRNNDNSYKYAKNSNTWCNTKEGVNQIGSVHSIQGWETDYIGVIIGPDLKYDKEHDCLCANPNGNQQDIPSTHPNYDLLIRNIYHILMTRGQKGCYVYACDPEVNDYLKRCLNKTAEE